MLVGYLAASSLVLFNLSLGFALYSQALLWNAFLHPKFGSLIWMTSPMLLAAGLLMGIVFGFGTPSGVRVESSGVAVRRNGRIEVVEWDQWSRRILGLGFFGAVAAYTRRSGPRVLTAVSLSQAQAREVVPKLRMHSERQT
jgi:hypothetical protein